jgi:hypothetical protein
MPHSSHIEEARGTEDRGLFAGHLIQIQEQAVNTAVFDHENVPAQAGF